MSVAILMVYIMCTQ